MKFFVSIFAFCFLASCVATGPTQNKSGDTSDDFKKISISCNDADLKDCGKDNEADVVEWVLKINDTVCDLGKNINPSQYENIFHNFDNRTDQISDISLEESADGIKQLDFTLNKRNVDETKQGRNINIMFDLTYFSDNKTVESDVFENRKKILKNIILQGVDDFKVNYGDSINLFYIGTSDYGNAKDGHKNYAITDTNTLILKKEGSSLSGKYSIRYICEKNTRKRTMKLYYESDGKHNIASKKDNSSIEYVDNLNSLNERLVDIITKKYQQNEFNRGTYLLESLDKNKNFLNQKDSINILISDMFFQIHPEMKKTYGIGGDDYNFNQHNILASMNYFENFYKNTIPNFLNNKCQNNEKLYILGIELGDNLILKRKMKEYYQDVLFERCQTAFNS